VPYNIQARLIAVGNNGQGRIIFYDMGGINRIAIDHATQCGFSQAGPNVGGYIVHGYGGIKRALAAVRQSNNRHEAFL